MKSVLIIVLLAINIKSMAQPTELDNKVQAFLNKHKGKWHDLNVPYEDGKILYDLIIKNHYTSALEIGTSTGHSTVWIAWAMSKTGGKVVTIEIDKRRHEEAIENLAEAGLSNYVDARLANAHELVKELPGPFDFVFSDADKDWYKQYFLDVHPKLKLNGCYTTHNVADGLAGDGYYKFVTSHPDYTTTLDRTSRAGVLISYKKK